MNQRELYKVVMTILFASLHVLDNVSSVNFQIENGDIVTKCDFELTKDVMANGWISSLGRSYCLSGYRGIIYG